MKRIVQTADAVVIVTEMNHDARVIRIAGEHDPPELRRWLGDSVGRWEGDTLVIDTALLSEWQVRPWPRSGQTHIVERVHLTKLGEVKARASGFIADSVRPPVNDDVLVVELTLTDPTYYDGPQRRNIYFQRMDDSATLEYLCTTEHWIEALEKQRIKPEAL
jgi:hypothetical protein